MNNIDQFTTERAIHQARYKRNRDHLVGSDAVKNINYLPVKAGTTQADHDLMVRRTQYFPATKRTAQGLKGLVFRKEPQLISPEAFLPFAEYVTQDLASLNDLAEKVFAETLATNFTGLLIDQPEMPANISQAEAFANGYRPYISIYNAETILETSYSIRRSRKVLSRVRLKDDAETIRELKLIDNVYTVVIHKKLKEEWIITSVTNPLRDGETMDEIPFVIVTDGSDYAALDDLSDMNSTHFIHSADRALVCYYVSAPIPVITGFKAEEDLTATVGSIWTFESPDTEAKYLEFSGAGVAAIKDQLDDIKADMAAAGSRILSNEKAAAEAAETLEIRRASENSVLAALANTISRKITDALKWIAYWQGLDEMDISFLLNTDFTPSRITPQEIQVLMAAVQAGQLSQESFYSALQKGEIVSSAIDYETERDRIDNQQIDGPVL